MQPSFAIELSNQYIRLMKRGHSKSWVALDDVDINAPDFDKKLKKLRMKTASVTGIEPAVVVILPQSEALFKDIDLQGLSDTVALKTAAIYMEKKIGTSVNNLSIWLGAKKSTGLSPVIAVLQTTLHDAEAFITKIGFRSAYFSVHSNEKDFPLDPVFRQTQIKKSVLPMIAATGVLLMSLVGYTFLKSSPSDHPLTQEITSNSVTKAPDTFLANKIKDNISPIPEIKQKNKDSIYVNAQPTIFTTQKIATHMSKPMMSQEVSIPSKEFISQQNKLNITPTIETKRKVYAFSTIKVKPKARPKKLTSEIFLKKLSPKNEQTIRPGNNTSQTENLIVIAHPSFNQIRPYLRPSLRMKPVLKLEKPTLKTNAVQQLENLNLAEVSTSEDIKTDTISFAALVNPAHAKLRPKQRPVLQKNKKEILIKNFATANLKLRGKHPKPRPKKLDITLIRAIEQINKANPELRSKRPKYRPKIVQKIISKKVDVSKNEATTIALQVELKQKNSLERQIKLNIKNSSRVVAKKIPRPPKKSSSFARNVAKTKKETMRLASLTTKKKTTHRIGTPSRGFSRNQLSLIGVYGSPSKRRAMFRTGSGRYIKVKNGERVGQWKVTAIGESSVRIKKSGKAITLRIIK